MNGMVTDAPEKPKPSLNLDFYDNSELKDMFQGVGLGDKFTVVITGKVTRLSEYGVTMQPLKISKSEEMDDEGGVDEDALEDEPVSVVLNAP